MARRTTASASGRTARRAPPQAAIEPASPERPRRGRKLKLRESQAEVAPAEDEAHGAAPPQDESPAEPAKPRRGRKPKAQAQSQPAPEAQPQPHAADDESAIVAELEQAAAERAAGTQAHGTPAAHWNAVTGQVVFDWPAIEVVAGQDGPNQAMAKLLLAARAEGASSRWPF